MIKKCVQSWSRIVFSVLFERAAVKRNQLLGCQSKMFLNPKPDFPAAFRERAGEQLPLCSSAQPGVRAAAEKLLVHGQQYLCVLKYSAFAK